MNQQLQNLSMERLVMDNEFKFSDEELILRFQKGDEQSYIELVNRYRDRLINFIYRFVNDTESAEDIVQDALLKVYTCLLYTSPSPRDATLSRMPSSA